MKTKRLFKALLLASLSVLLIQCGKTDRTIKWERAIVKGTVTGDFPDYQKPSCIKFSVSNPVTGDRIEHKAMLDEDGAFSFSTPVVNTTLSRFTFGIYSGFVPLRAGETTELHVDIENGEKRVTLKTTSGFRSGDVFAMAEVADDLLERKPGNLDSMSLDERSGAVIAWMNDVFRSLEANTSISEAAKRYLTDSYTLSYMNYFMPDLTDCPDESSQMQEFDRSYYSFLGDIDLNNPDMLAANTYSAFIQKYILAAESPNLAQLEAINLVAIDEQPVNQWQSYAKGKLSDLLGFDNGFFYDILAANSYSMQMSKGTPLTKKQKDNIKAHFGNNAYAKILLAKDDMVSAGQVNETVKDEENKAAESLINTILTENAGKVILVDFWATWCPPCMKAIEAMEPLKNDLKDKGAVFVYITTTSSPMLKWQEVKKGIDGLHYYVGPDEWVYLMKKFGFNSIPTYAIYDRDGKLNFKESGHSNRIVKTVANLL